MTTEPEAIPAETVEAIQEAAIEFGLMLTDEHATALAKAIADRASRAPVDGAEAKPVGREAKAQHASALKAIGEGRYDDVVLTITHPAPASPDAELVDAAKDVLAERERQKKEEGWTPKHDDGHRDGEIATAAACYALGSDGVNYVERLGMRGHVHRRRVIWPWSSEWWKPKDRRSNLVRAGALIIAEIERLDRLSKHGGDNA